MGARPASVIEVAWLRYAAPVRCRRRLRVTILFSRTLYTVRVAVGAASERTRDEITARIVQWMS